MKKQRLLLLIGLLIFGIFIGCGKMKPISGRVTFSDDGSPLTQGLVVFQTPSYQARGQLNENGEYTLSSLKEGDGIPEGEYSVFVDGTFTDGPKGKNGMPTSTINLVAEKFNGVESGLKFKVGSGSKTFDFKVDRPAGQK